MSDNSSSGGIGFTGLLTIVFIVLKLTHVIDWSWLWVLSPIWLGIVVVVVIVTLAFLFERWLNANSSDHVIRRYKDRLTKK